MLACPHCDTQKDLVILALSYDNGSARTVDYRCSNCECRFIINRQGKVSEIIRRGWTNAETHCEITRIAALQNTYLLLQKHNAPDEWYLLFR